MFADRQSKADSKIVTNGKLVGALMAALALFTTADPLEAQQREVINQGFELYSPQSNAPSPQYIGPDSRLVGWRSTNGSIEPWRTGFLGVPAQEGSYFLELNVSSPTGVYQEVCLHDGEQLNWSFGHRARSGGGSPLQNLSYEIATLAGANVQTLGTSSAPRNNTWQSNSGTAVFGGVTGTYRLQFRSVNSASYGNFLDNIQLDLVAYAELNAASGADAEASGGNMIALRVSGTILSEQNVPFSVVGGSADVGADYTIDSTTITVPVGTYDGVSASSFIPLPITIIDDGTDIVDETIEVQLGTYSSSSLQVASITCDTAPLAEATYTITNDDFPPVAVNDLSTGNAAGSDVTVNIVGNDTDPNGNTTLAPGSVVLIAPSDAEDIVRDDDDNVIGFTVPGQGTWMADEDTGAVTFDPVVGYISNPTPISYTIEDNGGLPSNTATITIEFDPLPTFVCEAGFYEVISGRLAQLNVTTGQYVPIGPQNPDYNATGYNLADNYVYGIGRAAPYNSNLVRVGSDGVIEDTGFPTGSVAPAVGEMGDGNILYFNSRSTSVNTINVVTGALGTVSFSGSAGGSVLDYSLVRNAGEQALVGSSSGLLRRWNLTTGVADFIAVPGLPWGFYGASWTDVNGVLYLANNDSGTVYIVGEPLSDSPVLLGTSAGQTSSNHDGMSCGVAPSPLPLPPFAGDDGVTDVAQGATAIVANIRDNDFDIDGTLVNDTVNLTPPSGVTALNVITDGDGDVTSFLVPNEGTWTYDPVSGNVTFEPLPTFAGSPTSITYTIDDDDGATSPEATISVTYIEAVPGIELIKSVSSVADTNTNGIYGDAGDTVNYLFTAANTGNTALAGITVSDTDLAALVGASTPPTQLTSFDGNLAIGEGLITPVEIATASYVLDVTDVDAGGVENTATVSATAVATDPSGNPLPLVELQDIDPATDTSDTGSDPAIDQNDGSTPEIDDPSGTDSDGTPGNESEEPTVLTLPTLTPGIELVKAVSLVADTNGNEVFGDVGDTITYSFTAENTGTTALVGIRVSDTDLDALDGEFILTQPAIGSEFSLAIGEGPIEVASATYVLADTDIAAGGVTNTAEVTSTAVATDADGNPDPDAPLLGVDPVTDDSDTGSDPAINQTDGSTTEVDDPSETDSDGVTGNDGDEPTVLTIPAPAPAIELVKSVSSVADTNMSGVFGDAGDTVNYSFTAENTGTTALAGIRVSDTDLDALDGDFVLTQPALGSEISLAIGEGPVEVATATYVLADTDIEVGGVTNIADVTSTAVATDVDGNPDPDTPLIDLDPVEDTSDAGSEPTLDRATGTVTSVDSPGETDTDGTPGNDADEPTVLRLQSGGDFVLTKSAGAERVLIGETVSYEISATSLMDADFAPTQIVDTMPEGMAFVPGSAMVDGVAVVPVVAGQTITFSDLTMPANGTLTIAVQARVLTSAPAGELMNVVDLFDQLTGAALARTASAMVMRSVETVFDCSPVIGKVFDDVNMNGYQDGAPDVSAMISDQDIFADKLGRGGKLSAADVAPQSEVGMPGVRLVTPSGTIITTDANGLYSVPCAEIPNGIGSNFMLKLDTRTLPTGYRVTTENPRVMRLTSGIMTEMNFGAAIGRVFDVDLSGRAYATGEVAPSAALVTGLEGVLRQIAETPTVIRISYYRDQETAELARDRLSALEDLIEDQWADIGTYRLLIEKSVNQLQ